MAFVMAVSLSGCSPKPRPPEAVGSQKHVPQGIARDFELVYTETPRELSSQDSAYSARTLVLRSPLNENYDNLSFRHQVFPKGLVLSIYDKDGNESRVKADYGIVYSQTNLIDLRGNVKLESHDGKILETQQLYFNRRDSWIFTEEPFTYLNPEEGTLMDGVGMDFNREFTYFRAAKTNGVISVNE